MRALDLRNYLNMVLEVNQYAVVRINGNDVDVNTDDLNDVDIYEVNTNE